VTAILPIEGRGRRGEKKKKGKRKRKWCGCPSAPSRQERSLLGSFSLVHISLRDCFILWHDGKERVKGKGEEGSVEKKEREVRREASIYFFP